MSGDGTRVLTGSVDHTAILWDAATARPIQTFKGHTRCGFRPWRRERGRQARASPGLRSDKSAILWDAETARPIQTFNGHTHAVTSVALSGDGTRVLTGSADRTAILWDAAKAKPIQAFKGAYRLGFLRGVES